MPTPEQMANLDLRNLAKADPREAQELLKAAEDGLQRGVDLSALRARRQHEHKWVVVAQFELSEKVLATMAEHRLRVADAVAKAADASEVEVPTPVGMPMGEENLLSNEGPGCVKCGAHWENPDIGYGQKCSVSDEQYWGQRTMRDQAMERVSAENFGALVERAKGAVGS